VKPVEFLAEQFNFVVRNLEELGASREKVSEMDGFMEGLVDEMKNVESGFSALFGEMLLIHSLAEGMATLENELELVGILGERIRRSLKTDLLLAYLWNEKEQRLMPCYKVLPDGTEPSDDFFAFALEEFRKGEARLHENKKIDHGTFHVLAIPLRTSTEKFGILFAGRRKTRGMFPAEDSTLIFAGATLVSFALSNFRLNQKILRDKQLVILGQTIGSISHDIKNILTGFEGSLDLISTGIREKDLTTIQEGTAILNGSYERMKEMALSMLDYAKNRTPDLEPKDFNRLLEEIIAHQRTAFQRKRVRIATDLDDRMPKIYVDPERIDRMVSNLLINALDAVKEGTGIVTLRTVYFPGNEIVHFSVEDNGKGIPPQALDKIFDLFYSTKGSRGSGFGLAIVQKVVREHGGTIEVTSTLHKGTKFLIKLPAKASS
jgi:signal transduction histidine kinase